MQNKLLLTSIILGLSILPTYAQETLSEMLSPQPAAYRVGLTDTPENQYVQAKEDIEQTLQIRDESNLADMTYADLSIKKLSQEIARELGYEEETMANDLAMLWQGAATQSDTINFALYKLSNPDADKPDEKSIKKVLTTIASLSTIVGAGVSNPVLAGSSLIGSNVLGIMGQDTKALNYKYTRVNDADMIILVRKIEDLQQKTIDLYYDYMSAKKQLESLTNLVEERKTRFETAQKNDAPKELIVIVDAYYRTATDRLRNAKADFYAKRASLEQFVGRDTLIQFENELVKRQEQLDNNTNAQDTETEYQKTVEEVKEYTSSLPKLREQKFEDSDSIASYLGSQSIENYANENYIEPLNDEALTGPSSNIDKETEKEIIEEEDNNKTKVSKKQSKIDKKAEKKEKKLAEKQAKAKTKEKSKKQPTKSDIIQQPRKTYPKNSTKDLIFLHGQDKHTYMQNKLNQTTSKTTNEQQATTTSTQPDVQLPVVPIHNKVITEAERLGLPPLEEIRTPDMHGSGYSIHSNYEDYYGSTTRFQY